MVRKATNVRIVGVVDRLGYLRCASCVDIYDHAYAYAPPNLMWHVWSDTAPHASEPCDTCGVVLDTPREG